MVEGGSEDEEIVNTYVLRAEYMLFVYLECKTFFF